VSDQRSAVRGPAARSGGPREFIADNVIVAAAQVLGKLRGIVTLPLIVKSMGAAGYGVWSQVLTFSNVAVAVFGFSLHIPLVRLLSESYGNLRGTLGTGTTTSRHEYPRDVQSGRTYSTLLLTSIAFAGVGISLLQFALPELSVVFLDDAKLSTHLAAGLGWVAVRTVLLLNTNVYRATRHFLLRSLLELFGSLVELAGIVWILGSGGSLLDALWYLVVWNAVLAAGTTVHALSLLGWQRPDWDVFSFSMKYSAPLVPVAFSVWALDRADRFFIGYYHGLAAVGIYSAANAVGSLVLNFQTPLQMTVLPKVGQLWETDRESARHYINLSNRGFLTLAIPFCIGIAIAGPPLLRLLGSAEIAASSYWLTPLVAIGNVFWGVSVMQHQMFHGARKTMAIGWISAASAALNVVLNVLLVPRWGSLGAAVATLIAYAAGCVVLVRMGRSIMHFDFFLGYLGKCVAASAVMSLVVVLALKLPGLPEPARLGLAALLAPLVYFAVLVRLRGFSPEERDAIKRIVQRSHDSAVAQKS
jgi:O-antigen/teichoic acid export membrane protein